MDVNDNAPEFTSAPVIRQIPEGMDIGTSVTTITATDPDSGINGDLKYSIRRQEPSGTHFTIDEVTGEIKTASEIDREFSDTFQLTVIAVDQADPPNTRKSAEKIITIIIQKL